MQNRKSCGNPGKQGESVNTAQWHPQILLKRQIFCFLLLVCPGFADDKSPGDVKLIELLKKFDSQAMRDSHAGKRHQAWGDARMAKLTKTQKELFERLWEAKRRMTSKEADRGLSYLKILEYIHHNEKPEK